MTKTQKKQAKYNERMAKKPAPNFITAMLTPDEKFAECASENDASSKEKIVVWFGDMLRTYAHSNTPDIYFIKSVTETLEQLQLPVGSTFATIDGDFTVSGSDKLVMNVLARKFLEVLMRTGISNDIIQRNKVSAVKMESFGTIAAQLYPILDNDVDLNKFLYAT